MQFTIRHNTHYRYFRPVQFDPHRLRFHPRDDGAQRVISHQLSIKPTPLGRNDHLDLEGNRVSQVWFGEEADYFDIQVVMQVETLRRSAFDFILAPEAAVLPINHEHDVICARAYLERIEPGDAVTAFPAELSLGSQPRHIAVSKRSESPVVRRLFPCASQYGGITKPSSYPAQPPWRVPGPGSVIR